MKQCIQKKFLCVKFLAQPGISVRFWLKFSILYSFLMQPSCSVSFIAFCKKVKVLFNRLKFDLNQNIVNWGVFNAQILRKPNRLNCSYSHQVSPVFSCKNLRRSSQIYRQTMQKSFKSWITSQSVDKTRNNFTAFFAFLARNFACCIKTFF